MLQNTHLFKNKEEYFHVLNEALSPIMIHDDKGYIYFINKIWTKITGYSLEEIPTIADWIQKAYGGDKDTIHNKTKELFQNNSWVEEKEVTITTKNKEKRVWQFFLAPLKPQMIITTATDITQRKMLENKASLIKEMACVAHMESSLQSVLKQALENICKYIDWPIGHIYIRPKNSEHLISSGIWCFKQNNQHENFIKATNNSPAKPGLGFCGRVLKKKKALWNTDVATDPNFLRREAIDNLTIRSSFAFPVMVQSEVVAIFEFFTSKVKKPDSDLLDLVDQIATLVAIVFEKKQANKEIEKARLTAAEAQKAKDFFLSNMSHEIKTPLNTIVGMNHLLQQTTLRKNQYDCTKKMYIACLQLRSIVDDILDYAKMESGKLNIQYKPFHLRKEVLIPLEETMGINAREKGLKFSCNIPPEIPRKLVGDPECVGQVLKKLVDNAIKYAYKGKIEVFVQLLEKKEESVVLKFVVTDTGIGIKPKLIDKLFAPFIQEDSSHTRKYGGTGLGLAICKYLVENMKGEIGCKSTYNKGSTFFFIIEFGQGTSPFTTTKRTPAKKTSNVKLLLVEDNELSQFAMKEILESQGISVTIASDGYKAIQYLKRHRNTNIILMDINMPGIDGYETTRIIRNEIKLEIPIIALTANSMEKDKKNALQAGMNDYISKTAEINTLFITLNKWIESAAKKETFPKTKPKRLPDHLPGLDIKNGLARVGNEKLYCQLLEKFYKNNLHANKEIKSALKLKNKKLSARLIHTLKGTAGMIGAKELEKTTIVLENAVKHDSLYEEEFKAFSKSLDTLLKSINQLPKQTPSGKVPIIKRSELRPLFLKFYNLLLSYDTEALEILEPIRQKLEYTFIHKEVQKLVKNLEQYDFEQTLECLKEISIELNISLTGEDDGE